MRLETIEDLDDIKGKVVYAVNDRSINYMWQFKISDVKDENIYFNWKICYVNKDDSNSNVDHLFNKQWHKSCVKLPELQVIEFFTDEESAYMYIFTNGQFKNE